MTKCRRISIKYLERSNTIDNMGLTPKTPRQVISFLNEDTFSYFTKTDVDIKKFKRNKTLKQFESKYLPLVLSKTVTVLGVVIASNDYPNTSAFLHFLKKKLQRKGVDTLGYVSARDVGEQKFNRHVHLLVAIEYINSNVFKALFEKKNHSKYNVIMLAKGNRKQRNKDSKQSSLNQRSASTLPMMINYLSAKELYGAGKQRSYSKSKDFRSPKQVTKVELQANKFELIYAQSTFKNLSIGSLRLNTALICNKSLYSFPVNYI